MKIKNTVIHILTLLTAILLIGCSPTPTNDSNASNAEKNIEENTEPGGELRVALNAQPPTLDPLVSTADVTRDVALQIFEPLVTINSKLQPVPMLAESIETSADGKTITFYLRQGVTFHNGKEMTSEDVVASMERWRGISSRAKAAFSNAKFVADDTYTISLELEKPNGTALAILASSTQLPAIMPKEIVETADVDGVKEYIGTGTFKFDEWKQDQYIKLSKYGEYKASSVSSDGKAGKREALVDDLYFMIVTDASMRIAGLQTGNFDIASEVPFDSFAQLEADPNLKTYTGPRGFNILVFNKQEGPFSNVKIRQAVAAALDMDAILKASHSDEQFYETNPGLMQEDQTDWYTDAGHELYNQKNPKKAKQLLEEAGYNGEPVTFLTSRDYVDFYNASVVIKEQLENIGMKVNLEVYDWATIIDKQRKPSDYDAFITGFGINTDPTQFLFLHSKNEWAGWTNDPKIDDLIEEIRGAASEEEAKAIFEKLQLEMWEYLPIIKFGDKKFLYAMNKDVEGFQDVVGMALWNVKKSK